MLPSVSLREERWRRERVPLRTPSSQSSPLTTVRSPQPAVETGRKEGSQAFMLRYKGNPEHWIGLRREQELGQPWKWANGSEFNHWFPIRGGGDCTYLNDEKGVSSSRCIMMRYWICSKPDAYTKGKGRAMGEKLQI
ncbi:C-type lectin domain family 2 member D-like [Trachemys scripta elegans]|uniref:C-type lectin domain family 2 member D-like n=1 Tax=Trachemys scripta elegans TaxID=31138 RepID=UPI001553EEA7|nr:C-type lectin domain family 2 member D-like [Trachemys scripta elegans]XP_034613555.1 C-type lectin domain family 2 member D-like [Trachemys scripta elegans]XP_034613557.1 C-type lectin domain family 2 member D-like [Trachemys scripta elegans]